MLCETAITAARNCPPRQEKVMAALFATETQTGTSLPWNVAGKRCERNTLLIAVIAGLRTCGSAVSYSVG